MKLHTALGGVLLSLFVAEAAFAVRVPFVKSSCSIGEVGITAPSGIAFNPSIARFAITDDVQDLLYITTAQCGIDQTFSTSVFGASSPQGVAFDVATNEYIIVDSSADELFVIDSVGLLQGQCDLAGLQLTNPTDVAARGGGVFAVTDSTADEVVLVDLTELAGGTCNQLARADTVLFGSLSPVGIEFIAPTAQYAVADNSSDDVFLLDSSFTEVDFFDSASGFDANSVEGLAYVNSRDSLYAVDSSSDLLIELDINGTSVQLCNTNDVVSNSPDDVTYVAPLNELAFIDPGTDTVYIAEADTCDPVRTIELGALGIFAPTGVSYRVGANQLLITDSSADELFFVGYGSGAIEAQCSLRDLGFASPNGVSAIDVLDQFYVVDGSDEATGVLDADCALLRQNSLLVPNFNGGISSATGLAYETGTARALVVDSLADQVYLIDSEGRVEGDFDTAGLGIFSPTGIGSFGDGRRFLISDSSADAVFLLDVPRLQVAQSVSGTFRSGGLGVPVVLLERGEGRLTGSVALPSGSLPAFGQYEEQSGAIVLSFVAPSGNPVSLTGTVSADLSTITLPAPLGTLTREF